MKQKTSDYLDHLEDLRRKLGLSVVFFLLVLVICFIFSKELVVLFQKPLASNYLHLYYFKPHEKFVTYLTIAAFSSFIATLPFAFVQLMRFIYPAVKKTERSIFWFFMVSAPVFFAGGLLFSYIIILPAVYTFFIGFSATDGVVPLISFSSHIQLLINIMLCTSFLFMLPLVLIVLIAIGVISTTILSKYRRYCIVLIAILAAIFSPPDILSMLFVGVPLYLLFEFAIIIGYGIEKTRQKRRIEWTAETL